MSNFTENITIRQLAEVIGSIINASSLGIVQTEERRDEDMTTTQATYTATGDYHDIYYLNDATPTSFSNWSYTPSSTSSSTGGGDHYTWTTTEPFNYRTIIYPDITTTVAPAPTAAPKISTEIAQKTEEVEGLHQNIKAIESAIAELIKKGDDADQLYKERLYRLYGRVWTDYMFRVGELLDLISPAIGTKRAKEDTIEEIADRYEEKIRGRYRLDI